MLYTPDRVSGRAGATAGLPALHTTLDCLALWIPPLADPPPAGVALVGRGTQEMGQRVQNASERVPEEDRCRLSRVADQDWGYDKVGPITQQSPDAVRGKLHRARKAFSAAFAKTG